MTSLSTTWVFNTNDVYRQSLEASWVLQGWNAGWFGGGYVPGSGFKSLVYRFSHATESAAASTRGNIAANSTRGAAVGNATDGWLVHGANAAPGAAPLTAGSVTSRVIFSNDTATSVAKGNLDLARGRFVGSITDRSTSGWFGGGYGAGPSYTYHSTVARLIFNSDTATTVAKGNLTAGRIAGNGVDNRSSSGWYMGGNDASSANVSTVDKVIFASDTAAAVAKGPLSAAGRSPGGSVSNTTDGWKCGLYTSGSTSQVDRIIFATDTATTVAKGPLTSARVDTSGGVSNPPGTIGWVISGTTSLGGGADLTNMNRITFASDTATAVAVSSGFGPVVGGSCMSGQ